MSLLHTLLGIKPGREDWSVKTGTDPDAVRVLLSPHSATIAFLAGLPAPHSIPPERVPPVEFAVYEVSATLTGFKEEADGDFHLVLTDPDGRTMIAEVPYPQFVDARSPFLPAITTARAAFEARFSAIGPRLTACSVSVTVVGVGFFDKPHGQTGVATNAIELHPVLSIEFTDKEQS